MKKRVYLCLLVVVIALAMLAVAGSAAATPGNGTYWANGGTSHTMQVNVAWGNSIPYGVCVTHISALFTDGASSSTVYFRMQNDGGAWTGAEGPNTVNGTTRTVWDPVNSGIVRRALQVKWGTNPWCYVATWY